jgi:hypothetical protein
MLPKMALRDDLTPLRWSSTLTNVLPRTTTDFGGGAKPHLAVLDLSLPVRNWQQHFYTRMIVCHGSMKRVVSLLAFFWISGSGRAPSLR